MDITNIVTRYAVFATLFWSGIVAASLLWTVRHEHDKTLELATYTARASFNKDQAYRLWASGHGGVYVEPTEKTPPNPYLEHIPDRDVITTDGKTLTLMNPAYMLREMMQDFSELYGLKGKITGKVVLNPINTADEWELKALGAFEQGTKEVLEIAELDGKPHLRLMRPMMMRESCLKCHGHLGIKAGEIRGGVGISVPLEPYLALEAESVKFLSLSHGSIWLLGLSTIIGISLRSNKRLRERQLFIEELELSEQVFANGMDGIFVTDPQGIILRVNRKFSEITGYTADEVIGKTPAVLSTRHSDKNFYQQFWHSLLSEGRWEGEFWNRRKDGQGFAMWESISSIRNDKKEVL